MKIFDQLTNLYEQKREFTILQGFYFAISLAAFFVAGLLALIDQSVGVATLAVPLAFLSIFGINLVAWALIRLCLDSLKSKKPKTPKTPSKK